MKNTMKYTFAAALTASAIANPAAAQDDESVFECFTGKLDEQIETFHDMTDHLAESFLKASDPNMKVTMELTYSNTDKENWIAACENETGKEDTGLSRGITSYSNNNVTITFEPR